MDIHTRLSVRGLHKAYKVPVLKGVDIDLNPGEIYGLVGENGAGKSTLINILCGLVKADKGDIQLDGKPVRVSNVHDAMRQGISVALQELSLIDELNIAENIFLRQLPQKGLSIHTSVIHQQSRKLLDDFGLQSINTHAKVASLSLAQKQLVEMCKALSEPSKLLILDEPTASLSKEQSELLHTHMHSLARAGLSILYVSHRLEDVLAHCSRISVLRDGVLVQTIEATKSSAEELIEWMSKGVLVPPTKRTEVSEQRVLEVLNCQTLQLPHSISLRLSKGEILGLAGLAGSGRTELLEAIYGLTPLTHGEVYRYLNEGSETATKVKDAAHAVALKIGMLSEDRKQQGIFAQQSLSFNASIAKLSRVTKGFRLQFNQLAAICAQLFSNLAVKHDSQEQSIEELSGGNQQKVLLARSLFAGTEIFLLDEPTRGVDVATKALIYQKLHELKAEGASAIVASSEIEELFTVCDRILVMSNQRISGELKRDEFSNERVLSLAFKNSELDTQTCPSV